METIEQLVRKIREAEQAIADALESFKANGAKAIADAPFDGHYINDGSNGGPVIACVKSSALARSWSPEHVLPKLQSEMFARHMRNRSTLKQVEDGIREMLDNGRVRIGGDICVFNETTLRVIRDSELGQHVMKGSPAE